MTLYETLFVVHPEKGPRMKEFIERFKKVVEGQAGTVSHVDEWGMRDLAYRIEKQGKGLYTLFQYRSSARAVEELERNLKLTDGILRYLTVRAEEEVPAAASSASKGSLEEQTKLSAAPVSEQPTESKTE
ncbi:MAG TPA: 30S ribosomal protein S6 [Methylomirabilota bacterium]|nr:30S ribosomal protein S6 [Methylomirabilota bacterium]